MTIDFLEDAIKEDLERLFDGELFASSAGDQRPLRIILQDLPAPTGYDETTRAGNIPEPCIQVYISGGKIADVNSAQEVSVTLHICLYNDGHPKSGSDRQGYRGVMHIIQTIYGRYARNPAVQIKPGTSGIEGGSWCFKFPLEWETALARPYYTGKMTLKFDVPAFRTEDYYT